MIIACAAVAALRLLLLPPPQLFAADSLFTSPSGRFTLRFIETEARVDSMDYNGNFTRYRIEFTNRISGQKSALEYTFLPEGYSERVVSPPAVIHSGCTWSPGENFVILPEERWQRAPGAPDRIAVNLQPSRQWSTARFRVNNFQWIDSLAVAGESFDDCEFSIGLFDGRTGIDTLLQHGEPEHGFGLIGIRSDTLFTKSIPDNCSDAEKRENFHSKTFAFPFDYLLHEFLRRPR